MTSKLHGPIRYARAAVWIAVVLAGCGQAAPPAANRAARPTGTPIEQARAYEHGRGVARDYRAAAEIYRTACNGGQGDVAACGALIRAQARGRGAARDLAAIRELATTVCVQRRDPFACVVTDLLSYSEASIPPATMAVIKEVFGNLHACDAAHMSECYATMWAGMLDMSDGSSAQARKRERKEQQCELGIIESCLEIVRGAEDDDRADVADAERRLQVACDAGDAEACSEAPDRTEVPLDARCKAADYEACAMFGCRGDKAAAAMAVEHGIDDDCARLIRPSRTERAEGSRAAAAEFAKLADEMCACKDISCEEQVESRVLPLAVGRLEKQQDIAAVQAKFDACRDRLLAANAASAAAAAAAAQATPTPPPPDDRPPTVASDPLDSRAILARKPTTRLAKVKHILLGWTEVHHGDRGAQRDRATLERLVKATVAKLQKGAKIEPLMSELSEDPGSATSGDSYTVEPNAPFVPAFKDLSLRLKVREVGVVRTNFGIHIIQRVE